ncbi:psbP domain-containing protein 4, chloroplastic [Cynara cardunculus var. scolymus]|uniref:Mog1/PsbP, alpha/beta/alpha sandwich n=1 Tax=Cynara cardunculus var. scolymus TaxID=59895 RepID=A0A118JZB9_CYNCS|nr:psbP domain-containing protein 4, chloroplastic [Cynara cardunculus var. scolymus]KVH99641.1 Mog1/PsbP, alpha/beta/alpha sandwich [Cynara cardunculus var. scolymus]
MSTVGFKSLGFSLKNSNQRHSLVAAGCSSSSPERVSATKIHEENENGVVLGRRTAMVSGVSLVSSGLMMGIPREGVAVVKQGLLAGRIPGLSEPNEQGWRTYRRPDEKSGGHGVGWSPIIPYAFSVPDGWEESPVSIADLGGTEIDLRFGSPSEGRLFVIVAPVLRFADYLEDDARIERIGPPEKVINAFGPEVIGENVEGKVMNSKVKEYSGRKYYQFELEPPHCLITATAAGNRLYLFNVLANGLQWKRHNQDLKKIADSFRIV